MWPDAVAMRDVCFVGFVAERHLGRGRNTTIHFDGTRWKLFPAPGAEDGTNYPAAVLDFSPTLAWAGGGRDE